MSASEPDLRRDAAIRIATVARQMRKLFDQDIGHDGLTRSLWTVIIVAARHPGATQRTIAQALDMTEAAAGRAIDRLCREGYLERKSSPDDRRAWCVWLTPKAEPLLSTLGRIGLVNEERAFAGFSDDELQQLKLLLDRVSRNVSG